MYSFCFSVTFNNAYAIFETTALFVRVAIYFFNALNINKQLAKQSKGTLQLFHLYVQTAH